MENLLNKARDEGFYQDIILDGVVHSGWRNCDDRWQMMSPYIEKDSVVIDIGSHYGYFGHRIATEKGKSIVWSFEADERRNEIQRLMLEHNGIRNVLLAKHKLQLKDFLMLSRVAEGIDYILCLSVIHYFPIDEIPNIIYLFSQISRKLIIEVPTPDENEVAEPETVEKLGVIERCLGLYYEKNALIGYALSPKDKSAKRAIFRAENTTMTKRDVIPYIGGHHGRKHNLEYDKKWSLDNGTKWFNGLNVKNLNYYNLVYPNIHDILREGAENYKQIMETEIAPTDVRPYNLIYTHGTVKPIDYTEKTGAYQNFDEYTERIKNRTANDFFNELKDYL